MFELNYPRFFICQNHGSYWCLYQGKCFYHYGEFIWVRSGYAFTGSIKRWLFDNRVKEVSLDINSKEYNDWKARMESSIP